MQVYQLFIDGQWVDPMTQRWLDSTNPYTGEIWAKIPRADKQDVDKAVQAAERAMRQGEWSRMKPSQRGQALIRFADVLVEHSAQLAT
ncbi:MAG: aldehyde dehydrogenase family protein, partial [Burkholderiaceae bacterium]|nr:aldehyde dehydrogenase family protein [Burkholderiaceae bacterium]